LDRRADVFGLGATACDLRYGRPPYGSVSEVLGDTPPSFPAPTAPHEAYFQHVVARMVATRRGDRYRDLAEPLRLLRSLAKSLHRPTRATVQSDGSLVLGATRIVCEVG